MVRLMGWFRSEEPKAEPPPPPSSNSAPKEDLWAAEIANLEEAFAAADLILDDNLDLAESRLNAAPSSSYRDLALAVISFIQAILGFEKDVMDRAAQQLGECEARALADQKKAQKELAGYVNGTEGKCGVYPPGTEYALVNAEAMLMGAVTGVLHEGLLAEGIRSFYKLRKAYFAVEAIVELENKGAVLEKKQKSLAEAFAEDRMPGSFGAEEWEDSETTGADSPPGIPKDLQPKEGETTEASSASPTPSSSAAVAAADDNDDGTTPKTSVEAEPFTNPRDVFIHSGATMCYGTLLFLFTLVPPALTKLLSIVGFRGDRERGIRMLWDSSAFPNVHGAIAGIVLLSYYNGLLGQADIVPPEDLFDEAAEIVGTPVARCEALLTRMRERYPSSGFWHLEQSKMHANARRLGEAIRVLQAMPQPNMRQVEALCEFEIALDAMFAMEWPLMRDSFLRCLELNEWSRTIYYYLAGCAEVEMYRDAVRAGDAGEAGRRKEAAAEMFAKAPAAAGKKRLLAKQLPFEVFVVRKLRKWEARVAEMKGVDLVDVIGVSPAQEMVYLWNGGRRLDCAQAERALGDLEWERCTLGKESVEKLKGVPDEAAVRGLCRAALLRVLGRIGEAKGELEGVMAHDRCVPHALLLFFRICTDTRETALPSRVPRRRTTSSPARTTN